MYKTKLKQNNRFHLVHAKIKVVVMRRSARKPVCAPTNLNSTLCDIFGDSMSKHRSCWLHLVAHHYRRKNNITWEEIRELKKRYRFTAPCFSRTIPRHISLFKKHSTSETSMGMDNHAVVTPMEGNKLECHLESLWENVSEDKRMSFAYLDCSWFSLYRVPSTRPKVLTWIKQKCIFSKKYVFVPIVCWDHRSLLILVHLGESSDAENITPCMLLLDYLQNEDPKRLEPEIRKFLADIYKSEGRTEAENEISQIPLLIPKVPQGKNYEECASYILYFISLFLKDAPDNLHISDGYPYFMVQNWFDHDNVESFRRKFEKELPGEKAEMNHVRSSCYNLRGKDGVMVSVDKPTEL